MQYGSAFVLSCAVQINWWQTKISFQCGFPSLPLIYVTIHSNALVISFLTSSAGSFSPSSGLECLNTSATVQRTSPAAWTAPGACCVGLAPVWWRRFWWCVQWKLSRFANYSLGINKIKGEVYKFWWHLMVRDRKNCTHVPFQECWKTLTSAKVLSTSIDIDNFFEKTKYLHFLHLPDSEATFFSLSRSNLSMTRPQRTLDTGASSTESEKSSGSKVRPALVHVWHLPVKVGNASDGSHCSSCLIRFERHIPGSHSHSP